MIAYDPKAEVQLWLGDCLALMPAIPSGSIALILTDPPYGHSNNDKGDLIHRRERALGHVPSGEDPPQGWPIANDGPEANEVFRKALPEFQRLLSPGCCCCCCCGGGGPDPQFARWSLWIDEVLDFKQMVVWDKGPMGMGWHYRRSYETILVAQKPGAACRWFSVSGDVENIIRPGGPIRKIIPSKDDHPTPKPVALAEHFIKLHTQEGDIVLDPFMGRGWVGVAALRLGRSFIGMEIDADHFGYAEMKLRGVPGRTSNKGQQSSLFDMIGADS